MNDLKRVETEDISKTVLTVCSAITSQFYRNKSDAQLRAERESIQMLTRGMDRETVATMCNMAAEHYAVERSNDSKQYFDINYIIRYYREAFNRVHNNPPPGFSVVVDWNYDSVTGIETYVLADISGLDVVTGEYGETVTAQYIGG